MMGGSGGSTSDMDPEELGLIPRLCEQLFLCLSLLEQRHREEVEAAARAEAEAGSEAATPPQPPAPKVAPSGVLKAPSNVTTASIKVSYLEIYNEQVSIGKTGFVLYGLSNPQVYDLFAKVPRSKTNKKMRVREHPTQGVYVEGLTVLDVSSYKEVML